jgi:hypothetical protein
MQIGRLISEHSSHLFLECLQASLSNSQNSIEKDKATPLRFLNAYYREKRDFLEVTTMGDHKEHMCEYAKHHSVEQMRERVRDAKFICEVCGRAANNKDYLCRPVDL